MLAESGGVSFVAVMEIELHCVSKSYPGVRVLDEVSADFAPGTIVALLGSNGAGKTTLLRCLATLTSPDDGSIRFDGEELRRGRIDLRRRLMFLPDFPPMLSGTDVLGMIAVHVKLWEADREGIEHRAADLAGRLELASLCGLPVDTLSRGQRYKTALASLLTVDPELWLLDEPFASGMDPQGIATFRVEAEQAARERGRIIVYSTQMVDLAAGFSDRIAVLTRGGLTIYDTVAELDRDPRKLDALLTVRRK